MTFPARYEVLVEGFEPTVNALGEQVDGFAYPVTVMAFAFAPAGEDKEIRVTNSGLDYDNDLYVPSWGFPAKSRVTFAGEVYRQVGRAEDYTLGPFGFKPGFRVNLKAVKG